MGEKKSTIDEPIPNWLAGLGSETLEQLLSFRSWLEGSGKSLGDEHLELVKQGWLAAIPPEHQDVH